MPQIIDTHKHTFGRLGPKVLISVTRWIRKIRGFCAPKPKRVVIAGKYGELTGTQVIRLEELLRQRTK